MAVNEEITLKLKSLEDEIKQEKENIFYFCFSILIQSESKEELDRNCSIIVNYLENKKNLSVAKESLNLKPLYFSFFPANGNLNARIRQQSGSIISVLINFENNILGFTKNSFGNKPVTILKHLNGSPFLFNFHESPKINEPGHTLVIGGTGYGKTTLMSFLMMNLMKYNSIDVFAMDKLNGMHNFTNFIGGEYHNVEDLKFNPFSLNGDRENQIFLKTFFEEMGGIAKEEYDEKASIFKVIERLYAGGGDNIRFKDFFDSLEPIEGLKIRYESYLESLFDNNEDALNFSKKLSVINMDSILKDSELSSLSAFYIFHKLKKIHKDAARGFFIWIDELKDF